MITARMADCYVAVDGLLATAEQSAVRDEKYLLLREVALARRRIRLVAVVVFQGCQREPHARDVGHVLVQSPEGVVAARLVHQSVVETQETGHPLDVSSAIVVAPVSLHTIALGRNGIPA